MPLVLRRDGVAAEGLAAALAGVREGVRGGVLGTRDGGCFCGCGWGFVGPDARRLGFASAEGPPGPARSLALMRWKM